MNKPNKPKAKAPFTPDELRVVLKWAAAYQALTNKDESIGDDTMFRDELARLRLKLKDAASEYMLGMLNAGFLLGFDSANAKYPLQDAWDSIDWGAATWADHPSHAGVNLLRRFLEEAGLIERK